MKLTLHIWRQKNPNQPGRMVQYEHATVKPHMSFLEMLDVLNEELIAKGEEPIAFDHGCRCLHRVRRLRRGLPQRRSRSVRRRKSQPPGFAATRPTRTISASHQYGCPGETRAFRQLHEHWRMRSRVSKGNQARGHCAN